MEHEPTKRKRGERGPDKKKRKPGSGMPRDRMAAPVKREKFVRTPKRRFVTGGTGCGGCQAYALTSAGYMRVYELAAEGWAIGSIANALGIGTNGFAALRKRDALAQEAIDAGRDAMATELSGLLMGQARQGNTVAAIFLAKARAGFVEQTGQVEGVSPRTTNIQVNISIPPAMSPDEFQQIIAGTTQGLLEQPGHEPAECGRMPPLQLIERVEEQQAPAEGRTMPAPAPAPRPAVRR